MRKQGKGSDFPAARAPPRGKGKQGARAGSDLDFVEAQPLREPDQLLCLLHAPHLGAAPLDDLGKGSQVTHPHSLPPLPSLPTASSPPPAPASPSNLADSTQSLLGILLAVGPLLCLAQDILGMRKKGNWAPALWLWDSEGLQLRGPCLAWHLGVHRAGGPASPLAVCITLSKSGYPSESQLPHL